jgi:hypothetical protein
MAQLLLVAAVGALIHGVYIAFNYACASALKLGSELGPTEGRQ